jgi:Sec-independent protein translocase protein TatA
MEVLSVGPLELLVIIVIALLVLGPSDLAKSARSAGRFLNRMYRSDAWRTITRASRDLRDLPNRLAREAALEELDETIKRGKEPIEVARESLTADLEGGLEAWQPSPKGEPSRPRSDQAFGPTPGGRPRSDTTEPSEEVPNDEGESESSSAPAPPAEDEP